MLVTKSHRIEVYHGLDHARLSINYSLLAPALPRVGSISKLYNPRAVSKQRVTATCAWKDIQTLEAADRCLKTLLETVCHIYNNDPHTIYYDPNLLLEAPQLPQLPTTPTSSYKPQTQASPDIAALVERQVEEDKLWRQQHSAEGATN